MDWKSWWVIKREKDWERERVYEFVRKREFNERIIGQIKWERQRERVYEREGVYERHIERGPIWESEEN